MRKPEFVVFFVSVMLLFTSTVFAGKYSSCDTVQDNILFTSDGYPIGPGFDVWGYNYGARGFQGDYCDAYHGAAWCQPYVGITLKMAWNDAWLSSRDCDHDGALDRHRGHLGYRGSHAWLTNHMRGGSGKTSWTYLVKIVAVPLDAYHLDGNWYRADDTLIGPSIWGDFAILLESEQGASIKGRNLLFRSPSGPGWHF